MVDGGEGDTGEEGDLFTGTPFGADDMVLMVCHLLHCFLAVGAVNHDAVVLDNTDYLVALHGFAARGCFGGEVLVFLVEEKRRGDFLVFVEENEVGLRMGLTKAFCYLMFGDIADGEVVENIDVGAVVEIAFQLSPVLGVVFEVNLLEVSFQFAATFLGILFLVGTEEILDGFFRVRCLAFVEPLFRRHGVGGGENLNLVASVKAFVAADDASVDLGTDAVVAEFGVDGVGEVEHRAARRQRDGASPGCEKIDFLGVEGFLELLDEVESTFITLFEGGADLLEPFFDGVVVDLLLGVSFLVEEVGRHTFFGDGVHAVGADLDFHPPADGSHDGGLEALVAVVLGVGDPVAEPVGVGIELLRDEGVDAEAFLFLFLAGYVVEDDAHGV